MSQVVRHCKNVHNCPPEIKCICDVSLHSVKQIKRHQHKHFPEYRAQFKYKCSECDLSYKEQIYLDKHVKLKHGANEANYRCNICSKKFRYLYNLKVHKITHLPTEQRTYVSCDLCDKKFTGWFLS